MQGSLFGETGQDALPDIELNWDWDDSTGIAMDSCDSDNEEGIYCDATQFGIALTKKMQALREFLEDNQYLPCPTNPAITELEEIIAQYNVTLDDLGFNPVQLYYPDCWMPLSTALLDGKPALLYFVEEEDLAGGVNWTYDVPDAETLRRLVQFRARLMKDGYSQDFRKDFADFYSTESFYNAPGYFDTDTGGKWADYFESGALRFKQRFSETTSLPDAGIYDVVVNIGFESGSWELFDASGQPDAAAVVEFLFLDQAYPNSVFYYMPFNGNLGVSSTNGRNGYGLGYFNRRGSLAITSQPEMVSSSEVYGSNPVSEAVVELVSDFKTLNSVASKRGFLLEIEEGETPEKKNVFFYPNYATPVLMKMDSERTEEAFSAFYELKDAMTPVEVGTSMSFWTGAGQCLDFSGSPVYEAFRYKPDREANELDHLSNWQFAYAVDWGSAEQAGDVYLKTVLYSPISGSYKLKALQPAGLMFVSPNSLQAQAIDLQGISGMSHNDGASSDVVSEVRELFELVEDRTVCITDTGHKTSFWWNPSALNAARGTRTSIEGFESALTAGSSCIGYS